MGLYDAKLTIRPVMLLLAVSFVTPTAIGLYFHGDYGRWPLIACSLSGLAGMVFGLAAQGIHVEKWLERRERRRAAREALDAERNICESASDLLPKDADVQTPVISGQTFSRLQRAIAAFPSQYPEYETRQPKLDDDIRPWLKATYGASDREAHVFGAIISEHFKF